MKGEKGILPGKVEGITGSNADRDSYYNLKIRNGAVHCIPLTSNDFTNNAVTGILSKSVAMVLPYTPTLCHCCVQLNLENYTTIILEFGKYYKEDNDANDTLPVRNAGSNFIYYYPFDGNEGGIRFYETKKTHCREVSYEIAKSHYQWTQEKVKEKIDSYNGEFEFLGFYHCKAVVLNKMTLGELINRLLPAGWKAGNYTLGSHDCQTFTKTVIEILKMKRLKRFDRIKGIEKMALPMCVYKAFCQNEPTKVGDVLGHIPLFGYFHDSIKGLVIDQNEDCSDCEDQY